MNKEDKKLNNLKQPNLQYQGNEIPFCATKEEILKLKKEDREKKRLAREKAKAEAERPLTVDERKAEPYMTYSKMVKSGPIFEFYDFQSPIILGRKHRRRQRDHEGNIVEPEKFVMSEEDKIKASAKRAQKRLRQVIYSNAFEWINPETNKPYLPITLTLTFKDEIRDIEEANQKFNDFISRLNYSINKVERGLSRVEAEKNLLKYSAVIEFQDKNRGGVVHYHILFYNLPKMNRIYDRLAKIWGKGYFWVGSKKRNKQTGKRSSYVGDTKQLTKVIDYFTKYISKNFEDPRLKGKKRYFNATGLKQPENVYIEELIFLFKSNMPEASLSFEKKDLSYPYKHTERFFDYAKYDLSLYQEELKIIKEQLDTYS